MVVRRPCVAGAFYPGSAGACRRQLEACLAEAPPDIPAGKRVVGAAVPHAGWTFSGPTAGLAYSAIRRSRTPGTFVLLGASHSPYVRQPTLMGAGTWETPLGRIEIDADLAGLIRASATARFIDDARLHEAEHSLEVQVPFIQHLFPEARIVPVIVPPARDSHLVGRAVADAIGQGGADAVVVGSADLTHYGSRFGMADHGTGATANAWVKEVNDRRMVDLLLGLKAEAIVAEAAARYNSCGSGALAALVAAAVGLGADGALLLRQTTSYEVQPDPYGDTIVGYASVAYLAPQ